MKQYGQHFDGSTQERHNSSALAMELRLSCINPSIYPIKECDVFDHTASSSESHSHLIDGLLLKTE